MKKLNFKLAWKVLFHGIQLPENKMEVVIVDDTTQLLSEGLGITPERWREIADILTDGTIKNDNLAHILINISKECKHANEFSYACFVLGHAQAKLESPFTGLLKSILGK